MKTLIGIFTKEKLPLDEAIKGKQYSFNSADNIEVDDHIQTEQYRNKIQVVAVVDPAYRFVNIKTGDLSNIKHDDNYVPIREINLLKENGEKLQGLSEVDQSV